ncbi:hypothetical protein [Thalassotalea sp. Y01]|uniref:hypothetical protein n=1 Tax=Thalassotalea sp. Y01 TaxID=2729613 RepID=UPI00145E888E|nr:hypothetical protein [Thalassotalea sp. Y01]NMP16485.1 hypothetical protein [Thalassotalea sp. Y01]
MKLIKPFIIILLLLFTITAARYGVANALFKSTENQIKTWQTFQPSHHQRLADTYQDHIDNIDMAIALHHNPQYIETKAQLLEWGIRLNLVDKTASLRDANILYLQSTQLRPSWPVTWASLAINKWHLGEFDQEFVRYLLNAYRYGKNHPQVTEVWQYVASAVKQNQQSELSQIMTPYAAIVDYYHKPLISER